jgi:hypothetical protein
MTPDQQSTGCEHDWVFGEVPIGGASNIPGIAPRIDECSKCQKRRMAAVAPMGKWVMEERMRTHRGQEESQAMWRHVPSGSVTSPDERGIWEQSCVSCGRTMTGHGKPVSRCSDCSKQDDLDQSRSAESGRLYDGG